VQTTHPAGRDALYRRHMRVIGGRSRGRRLSAPLPATVRPTADRVRESIFDVLGSMGGVVGLSVVDLFCGSGALGLEALSRGAARAVFVDHDPNALGAARANAASSGLAECDTTYVLAGLPRWLRDMEPVDLALCDPPYEFSDWPGLLGQLKADVAVLESGQEIPAVEGWQVTRSRRYGTTIVTVVRHNPAEARATEVVAP
jgi:16S rRNA (guanine966-N2)-methyltransferase